MFGRADFAWAARGRRLKSPGCWGRRDRRLDALRPRAAAFPSARFPSGGYAVMRTGWQPDAHHMVVDVGPIGCPVSAAHRS
jgi:hypothetical protein